MGTMRETYWDGIYSEQHAEKVVAEARRRGLHTTVPEVEALLNLRGEGSRATENWRQDAVATIYAAADAITTKEEG